MELFSEKEIQFLVDTDFLRTKQEINQKITTLLSKTEQALKSEIEQSNFPFPEQVFLKSGKISRGEQYRGLPYWVLDYPRKFSKEATFSFRIMIWWGNEMSCFLHLGGKDLDYFMPKVLENFKLDPDQFISINPSPWEYHFGEDNYLKAMEIQADVLEKHIIEHRYHKMVYRFQLKEIEEIPNLANISFRKILSGLR